jgi:hypothetical protein
VAPRALARQLTLPPWATVAQLTGAGGASSSPHSDISRPAQGGWSDSFHSLNVRTDMNAMNSQYLQRPAVPRCLGHTECRPRPSIFTLPSSVVSHEAIGAKFVMTVKPDVVFTPPPESLSSHSTQHAMGDRAHRHRQADARRLLTMRDLRGYRRCKLSRTELQAIQVSIAHCRDQVAAADTLQPGGQWQAHVLEPGDHGFVRPLLDLSAGGVRDCHSHGGAACPGQAARGRWSDVSGFSASTGKRTRPLRKRKCIVRVHVSPQAARPVRRTGQKVRPFGSTHQCRLPIALRPESLASTAGHSGTVDLRQPRS